MVDYTVILISLMLVLAAYLHVSLKERTYLNVFTPTVTILLSTDYFLELYNLSLSPPTGSHFAFALIYACYAGAFCAFVLGYTTFSTPVLRLPFSSPAGTGNRFAAYLVFAVGLALYWPVLKQFHSALTNPRQIYDHTRVGTGIYFFLSTTICYLAFVLLLFKRKLRKAELILFTIASLAFLWLHGSKNQMLLIVFILAIYWTYIKNHRVALHQFLIIGALLASVGLGLFFITNPLIIIGHRGLRGIAAYSDYTHNGMLVIDSDLWPLYGKLTIQQEIYSFIPRQIDPDKPRDFGSLYLAKHFYPYRFERASGAPAFSYGTEFADFGPLALPFLLLTNFAAGILLKLFVTSLRKYRDPGSFTLVLFSSGLTLLPISAKFVLPEALLFSIAVNLFHSTRLLPSHRGEREQAVLQPNSEQ